MKIPNKYTKFWAFLLILISSTALKGNQYTDSLKNRLLKLEEDTNRVEVLFKLSGSLYNENRHSKAAEHYFNAALKLSEKLGYTRGIVRYWDTKGYQYRNSSDYSKALNCHFKALSIAKKENLTDLLPRIYNNIGVVYRRLDEYKKGLDYHLQALKISEQIDDERTKSYAINSIGNIYLLMGQPDKALNYFNKSLITAEKNNNTLSLAINYNNIGEAYEEKKNFEKALTYYNKSLIFNQKINNIKGIAICYDCMGNVYKKAGEHDKALSYYQKALQMDEKHGDRIYVAISYINVGEVSTYLNDFNKAEKTLVKGLEMAKEIGSKMQVKKAYSILSELYKAKGKYKDALAYHKKSIIYKDSILNEKNNKAIAKLQAVYNSEKQKEEIEALQREKELREKIIKRKSLVIFLLIFAIALAVILTFVSYRGYKIKQKNNKMLKKQSDLISTKNEELEQQKYEIEKHKEEIENQRKKVEEKNKYLESAYEIIDTKNKKITGSISYARRIQQALLPAHAFISNYFDDFFILNRPKDIVSGDFYWLDNRDGKVFFSVADCTGHGVPGAFMSFVGFNLLNQALNEERITKPSDILTFIHNGIKKLLRKEDKTNTVKDGMDIALCSFNPSTYQLEYSGALNPLYIIRNKSLIEYKANYTQIGEDEEEYFHPFNNDVIELQPGDNIYLFSDGYIDQLGGPKNRKFLKKRFIKTLEEISMLNMNQQNVKLNEIIDKWQGDNEQVDDILIFGIKIH